MDKGSYEKLSIRNSARSLKKYGSTSSKLATRNENYTKHYVLNSDTLQGIALKYNVTIEQIRRANKLWASDSLFLKEFLLIPTTLVHDPSDASSSSSTMGSNAVPVTSPTDSCDDDNIDEFLNKIDASIASTKEVVKRTAINSEFAPDVGYGEDRRRPAISRMKQMVNNNGSNETFHPNVAQTTVSSQQQGKKKVRTFLKQSEQLDRDDDLFEL